MIIRYGSVALSIILALVVFDGAIAQSDPIGAVDVVYIDSVETGPGREIPVGFSVRNDEPLGSVSIPITYDASLLTLKSIDFEGSRAEHIATKLINPEEIKDINGHFVIAVVQILEDPIAAGDGMIFRVTFAVSETAVPGTVTSIDTLSYPPSGDMILVGSENATIIRPAFVAGQVVIGGPNRAPAFVAKDQQYVLEGDSLVLDVSAYDPDDDALTIAVTSKPAGATFVDNGDGSGQLIWVPDFIGPNSADGSPFVFSFRASDGEISVGQQIEVVVVNRNRAPVINAPLEVIVDAGKELSFSLSTVDPDFEAITWTWASDLDGAAFDGGNPGTFVWQSALTDTGTSIVTFMATDPHGFADTATVIVEVNAATIYVMKLDTVEVFPGDNVEYQVFLDNMVTVSGFNVLFNCDPIALTVLNASNTGTRSESFEYFNVTFDDKGVAGNIRLVGIADQGSGTALLSSGEGAVAKLTFRVTSNLAYSGMTLPVRFRLNEPSQEDDNTLSDTLGLRIDQDDISHIDGYVQIVDIGEINIGDINLNGLAAEISDVIYFTNFFIDPGLYSFNALQYANSDVNRDNIVATISDLVALINMVIGGQSLKPAGDGDLHATVDRREENSGTVFSYDTDFELGGLFISLKTADEVDPDALLNLNDEMIFDARKDEGELRIVVYSLHGETLPSGEHDLFSIKGLYDYSIEAIDLASSDGQYVTVALGKLSEDLPADYALHQNYPNPFNPETSIRFDMPHPGRARLVIYNILGQEVRTLTDAVYPAGSHTVRWNSADEYGQAAASGIYLYRLETETTSLSRKMMLLK